jgi:chromate transporter
MMFSLLISLFLSFFRIGLFGFGGGYAMLALIEREIIQTHQWLNVGEFVDVIALAEMTPGPVAINAATFVGYEVAGPLGAITATLGVIFPSLLLVIPAARLLTLFYRHQGLQRALLGIHPAVLSLIALAAFLVGKNAIVDLKSAALAGAALLLLMFTRVHPLILLAIGAAAGMLLYHSPN